MSQQQVQPQSPVVLLEICVDSFESARIAQESGANRIELCSSLVEGGITPSAGLIQVVTNNIRTIPIHVLIRPRAGDFCYNADELQIILSDIALCKQFNVAGIVIGVLNPDTTINMTAMQTIIEAAKPMNITFHRAFDMCENPFAVLDQLIQLNKSNASKHNNLTVIQRLLTSGQRSTAIEGAENINSYISYLAQHNSSLIVMAGAGLNETNISLFMKLAHCKEIHASARSIVNSRTQFKQLNVFMGGEKVNNTRTEYELKQTDSSKVSEIIKLIQRSKES